eukprot:2186963-Amphidinium_carterae.1
MTLDILNNFLGTKSNSRSAVSRPSWTNSWPNALTGPVVADGLEAVRWQVRWRSLGGSFIL